MSEIDLAVYVQRFPKFGNLDRYFGILSKQSKMAQSVELLNQKRNIQKYKNIYK